jgi:protein SCO1/2
MSYLYNNLTAMEGMGRMRLAIMAGLLFCALNLYAGAAASQGPHGKLLEPTPASYGPAAESSREQKGEARISIPDIVAVNQEGKQISFYSDLVKGKVVIISFVITHCRLICPLQGANLARLQAALGDRLGREVNLISISMDPEADTPERLKAWGAQFGLKPGWTLVTGAKSEIDKVAMALTGAGVIKGEHSPAVFVGNAEKGRWIRCYGLAEPERFLKLIEEVSSGSSRGK